MRIRTPRDLGLVIRDRRRALKLNQADLAQEAGVGRQWIIAIEGGKPRAELGLVLRTLSALGLSLAVDTDDRLPPSSDSIPAVDIDAIVSAATRNRA